MEFFQIEVGEKKLPKFLEENKDNAASAEFLIPDVLFEAIEDDVLLHIFLF